MNLLLQKSAPETSEFLTFILILFAILFALLMINNLIEWLRTKPWKRNNQTAVFPENKSGDTNLQSDNNTQKNFLQPLNLNICK